MSFISCPACALDGASSGCDMCGGSGVIHTSRLEMPIKSAEPREDTSVDWSKPFEPGAVKIDVQADERKLCEQDAIDFGTGYMVDGKRVHPSRVIVFKPKTHGNET